MNGTSSVSLRKQTRKRKRKRKPLPWCHQGLATIATIVLTLNAYTVLHVDTFIMTKSKMPVGMNRTELFQNDPEVVAVEDNNYNNNQGTIVTLESLVDLDPDFLQQIFADSNVTNTSTSATTLSSTSWREASRGKAVFLNQLLEAGIDIQDIRVIQLLPTVQHVEQLYGKLGPRILGLAQCESFRNTIVSSTRSGPNGDGRQRPAMGIAGMFNSGTNLAALYLEDNCIVPSINEKQNSGKNISAVDILWQVPWGKHVVAEMRKLHSTGSETLDEKSHYRSTSHRGIPRMIDHTAVMPIVMIRDPFFWMQSQCRQSYGAQWLHSTEHCPNLVPNHVDYKLYNFPKGTIPVRIKYDFGLREWDSLAHLWTLWYQQYYNDADYPRLLVRYEDFVFYPKQVTEQICACAGGTARDGNDFRYQIGSAKRGPGHGAALTSWVSAMIRYGIPTRQHRLKGLTQQDLSLADDVLDLEMMQALSYQPSSCC